MMKTTAYHPEGNGSIERDHKTLGAYLKIATIKNPAEWDDFLEPFCFSLNSTPRDRTTYSPAYLMYGQNLRLPLVKPSLGLTVFDTDEYVAQLCIALGQAFTVVSEEHRKREEKSRNYANRFRRDTHFELGTIVFKRIPRVDGISPKLLVPWKGPYKITKAFGNNLDYEITDISGSERVRVDKLASFTSRTTEEDDDRAEFLNLTELEILKGLEQNRDELKELKKEKSSAVERLKKKRSSQVT